MNGHVEAVRLLLDSRADPNLANKVQPPFHPSVPVPTPRTRTQHVHGPVGPPALAPPVHRISSATAQLEIRLGRPMRCPHVATTGQPFDHLSTT